MLETQGIKYVLEGDVTKLNEAISKAIQSLDKLQNAFKESSKADQGVTTDFKSLGNALSTLSGKMNSLTKSTNLFNKSANVLKDTSHFLSNAFHALVGISVGEWLSDAAASAINFVEDMNLFNVAMGDAVDTGRKFVDTMSEMYGLDEDSLVRYAGNFYQLSDAINMPTEAASKLSLGLTKATVDIASLFNYDFDQVYTNLASGMQGMTKAVRKYGMDVRVVTLQAKALELGVQGDVDSMSEADRQALRYLVMMEQASNANSDFARTIEAPANQLRIFKEQTIALGRAIGNFFLAPLQKAAQYVNGFVMALRTVISYIGSLLGVTTDFSTNVDLSGATDQVDSVGSAAEGATKSLKKMLAPFDELNILSQESASSGGIGGGGGSSDVLDPALAEAIAGMDNSLEKIKMRAQEVREAILAFLGFDYDMDSGILGWSKEILQANLEEKFPQWTKSINTFFDNWTRNTNSFKKIWKGFGKVVSDIIEDIKDGFKKLVPDESLASFIEKVSDRLEKLGDYLEEHHEEVAKVVETTVKWAVGLKILSTLLAPLFGLLGNIITVMGSLNLAGITAGGLFGEAGILTKGVGILKAAFAGLTSPIGLVIAAIIALMVTSEDFRNAVGNLLSSIWDLLSPFLELIDSIISIVVDELMPAVLEVVGVIGDAIAPIIDLIADILSALAPIVEFIVNQIQPTIKTLLQSIENILVGIRDFFSGIAEIIRGIVDIIEGILSGDFELIGKGLLQIFVGVLNAISGIVETVVNSIIGVMNTGIRFIWDLLTSFVNGLIEDVNGVLDFLGFGTISWRLSMDSPQIPLLNIPKVQMPAFATGGVVTGPTVGLLGEAGKDEAVIPLDNSPQMRNFISEIVAAINNDSRTSEQPMVIKVFVGNEQLDEYFYKAQGRRNLRTNGGQ